jgi:hypothetical protein
MRGRIIGSFGFIHCRYSFVAAEAAAAAAAAGAAAAAAPALNHLRFFFHYKGNFQFKSSFSLRASKVRKSPPLELNQIKSIYSSQ